MSKGTKTVSAPNFDEDIEEPVQDELAALKARADLLKITYHPSIGVEKLREKIAAALAEDSDEEQEPAKGRADVAPKGEASAVAAPKETEAQRRSRKRREAAELIRIRVTCMNPNKKEWEGEIIAAGNSVVGTYKKFVPFNADEGWHVPRIIYQQLVQRQCQIFTTKRGPRGNSIREGKMINEFAIEVLPPLTKAELHDLAQRQAMAKSID